MWWSNDLIHSYHCPSSNPVLSPAKAGFARLIYCMCWRLSKCARVCRCSFTKCFEYVNELMHVEIHLTSLAEFMMIQNKKDGLKVLAIFLEKDLWKSCDFKKVLSLKDFKGTAVLQSCFNDVLKILGKFP